MLPCTSVAGIFGPDNYEECVLQKMKGQNKSLLGTARRACRKKFPIEPVEEQIPFNELYGEDGGVDIDWIGTSHTEITIKVTKNKTNYKVTKVKMNFSTKSCEKSTFKDYTEQVEFNNFSMWSKKSSAMVENANKLKCMQRSKIIGILQK